MSRAPWRWRPRHAPSAFTRSISHSPGCRVARGSRGKRPLVRWEPRRAERATPRSAETDAWRRLAGGARSPIEPLQQPSRHRKIVVRSKRDGRGKLRVCGDGCTRQQHSAPPKEYLLVFQRHRYEARGGVVGPHRRAHQLHPLEFRLWHRATPTKLSRPNTQPGVSLAHPILQGPGIADGEAIDAGIESRKPLMQPIGDVGEADRKLFIGGSMAALRLNDQQIATGPASF